AQREGPTADSEPADKDDSFCFPASASTLVFVSGCIGTNSGFDGVPYQAGTCPSSLSATATNPSPILFSSPRTGQSYNLNYSRAAFEADLPRIEGNCVRTGATPGIGCTLIPQTDDKTPAAFYPYFSTVSGGG